MLRAVLVLAALSILAVCCGGGEETSRSELGGEGWELVSRSDFGSQWPLAVSEARLFCEPVNVPGVSLQMKAVWVEVSEWLYPLNGTAITWLPELRPDADIGDLERIWRNDPSHPGLGLKVNVGPLIGRGLELC